MDAWMTIRQRSILVGMVAAAITGGSLMVAQQPPAPQSGQPAPQGQPGAGPPRGCPRGPLVEPMDFADTAGFKPIFNGTSLEGWEGDTTFWRAEGGAIVGETTAANPLKANTFLIWRGG